MSIDFPSFGLSTPMPETLPALFSTDAPAEVPAAEGVVVDPAAIELATVVFEFISRFSSFSNIVAQEAETSSETENSQPDSEIVAKNDLLDSLAEVYKHTTTTISNVFYPILEKLGNLAHLIFKNLSNSEPAKPTARAHAPSHIGKIGSSLTPRGTAFTGRTGNGLAPHVSLPLARGCSIAR